MMEDMEEWGREQGEKNKRSIKRRPMKKIRRKIVEAEEEEEIQESSRAVISHAINPNIRKAEPGGYL